MEEVFAGRQKHIVTPTRAANRSSGNVAPHLRQTSGVNVFKSRECQQQAPFLGVCVCVCVYVQDFAVPSLMEPAARAVLLHCSVITKSFSTLFCGARVAFMFVALCM